MLKLSFYEPVGRRFDSCPNKVIDLQKIKTTAEDYYRNGDFFCSESIIKTIKDEFGLPISDNIVAMASGFPVGMGGVG